MAILEANKLNQAAISEAMRVLREQREKREQERMRAQLEQQAQQTLQAQEAVAAESAAIPGDSEHALAGEAEGGYSERSSKGRSARGDV